MKLRKLITSLVGFVVLVGLLGFQVFKSSREKQSEAAVERALPFVASGGAAVVQPVPAHPDPEQGHSPRGPLHLAASEFDSLSPESRALMFEALVTFQSIEVEKRKFARWSPGERVLNGLQRKLFLDDYTYAMLLSGADCSRAVVAYSNLVEQIAGIEVNTIEKALTNRSHL